MNHIQKTIKNYQNKKICKEKSCSLLKKIGLFTIAAVPLAISTAVVIQYGMKNK